jgi:4-hydroxy-L-threonine phosphate dehydrogenase PdxA
MNPSRRPKIAIATGDAGGIGLEISLKSALTPSVRNLCCPILVSDPILLEKHAKASGLPTMYRVIERLDSSQWQPDDIVVLDPHFAGARDIELGEVSASSSSSRPRRTSGRLHSRASSSMATPRS